MPEPASTSTGNAKSTRDAAVRTVLVWSVGFLAFRVLAPYTAGLFPGVILPGVIAVFMLLSLLGPRILAPIPVRPWPRAALFAGCIGLTMLTAHAQWAARGAFAQGILGGYSDLFLIGAAGMLGQMLAGLFREVNILAPVAIVAAGVDYWGVNYGTTRAILEKHAEVAEKLSVQAPVLPGVMDIPLGIGFGDFVFLSLFLACVHRFGMNERRTFWLSYALLLPAAGVVMALNLNVPALVPMAVAFAIANARHFRFQRSEVVAMAYAVPFLAVVIVLIWRVLMPLMAPPPEKPETKPAAASQPPQPLPPHAAGEGDSRATVAEESASPAGQAGRGRKEERAAH